MSHSVSLASAMLDSARRFLAALSPEQSERCRLPFESDERFTWYYTPRERKGVPFKQLDEQQRKAGLDLLRVGLSQQGFHKVETIRSLENVLHVLEAGQGPTRDPERYYFTLFGEPGADHPWGWRFEGHHVSLHWTSVEGHVVASTPQFLGSNPAEVRSGPMKGTRVLAAEGDLARALVRSLNADQRRLGVLGETAPSDIVTGNRRQVDILEDRGIAYDQLDHHQKGLLFALLNEYAGAMPPELARQRLESIKRAGYGVIKYAWMGGTDPGQGHYYRIQGKTFLIEYDNSQNDANHIHTVWRDFHGDWGRDALLDHYQDPHGHHAERETQSG